MNGNEYSMEDHLARAVISVVPGDATDIKRGTIRRDENPFYILNRKKPGLYMFALKNNGLKKTVIFIDSTNHMLSFDNTTIGEEDFTTYVLSYDLPNAQRIVDGYGVRTYWKNVLLSHEVPILKSEPTDDPERIRTVATWNLVDLEDNEKTVGLISATNTSADREMHGFAFHDGEELKYYGAL